MEAKRVDVIIAGAGPTGLMLACQLRRLGVDFLVLDKKSGPTHESRALVVQARSMEIYEQMGLSKEVEREGRASDGISFYKDGRQLISLSLKNMGGKLSPFPYVMIYEQSNNERLLYKDLQAMGGDVLWDTEIADVRQEGERHIVETGGGAAPGTGEPAGLAGGADEPGASKAGTAGLLSCTWLVACDGSKSKVRETAGVEFKGGAYENIFFVADTHLKGGELSPDNLSLFFTRASISLLFPMAGEQRFRVLGVLPTEYYHREDIGFDDIIATVRKNLQLPVEFYETQWYSTYKLYTKKVTRFNKGNIFFAGDAAHVHSPAGGQGMNTGLQDAYNLAWKLALVVKGEAGSALLETYHEERNPIATRLLKTTDRMFAIMTGSNRISAFVKMHIIPRLLPLLNKRKKLRPTWFGEVSQTRISYARSSLSSGAAGRIKAGQRLPWFSVEQNGAPVSIYALIREGSTAPFVVLLYNIPDTEWLKLNKRLFTVVLLEVSPVNEKALKEVGLPSTFVAVIRPDMYIGYLGETGSQDGFVNLMRGGYFIEPDVLSKSEQRPML
jgi:2-polyprenyl-6-methoxyphenol hydroxylase-like FAD-dependent oxidoreductase